MTAEIVVAALAVAVLLGVVIPWGFMRMLAPSLSGSASRENYRGRSVFLGLGVVWLVWAGCAIVFGALVGMFARDRVPEAWAPGLVLLSGPLALVAFALGQVDDSFGTPESRGFKGHFRAIGQGRMTTGMLKLIGISLASLVVALVISEVAPWGSGGAVVARLMATLVAGASIALTSNLVNLLDLRPGRAMKAYLAIGLPGAILAGLLLAARSPSGQGPASTITTTVVGIVILTVFVVGPVFAVWRFDLGEQGMLGDAGANPMGAVAGLLVLAGLPWWGLGVYFAAVLGLNLLSERVSFSRLIDASPPLRWLDRLGRGSAGAEETREEGTVDVGGEG